MILEMELKRNKVSNQKSGLSEWFVPKSDHMVVSSHTVGAPPEIYFYFPDFIKFIEDEISKYK